MKQVYQPEDGMEWPEETPIPFTSAPNFVRKAGNKVWCELCDECLIGHWYSLEQVALNLECLRAYKNPVRYLRAVLNALTIHMKNFPEDYPQPLFELRANPHLQIKL